MLGTFMGGLKHEILEGIKMFKPTTLKDVISLARMRDEQLQRQLRFTRPTTNTKPTLTSLTNTHSAPPTPIKQLS